MASKTETVDRFGSRTGTQSAKINKAMTTKPQTLEQLATKTKLSVGRVRNHMAWLLARKHIVGSAAEGFRLAPKARRKRKATK